MISIKTAIELDRIHNVVVTKLIIIYVVSKDGDDVYGNDHFGKKIVGFLINEANYTNSNYVDRTWPIGDNDDGNVTMHCVDKSYPRKAFIKRL